METMGLVFISSMREDCTLMKVLLEAVAREVNFLISSSSTRWTSTTTTGPFGDSTSPVCKVYLLESAPTLACSVMAVKLMEVTFTVSVKYRVRNTPSMSRSKYINSGGVVSAV